MRAKKRKATVIRWDGASLPDVLFKEAERAARRAVNLAGAVPPLEYVGAGMTSVVFCDARGRGFKVARNPASPTTRKTIAREAEWLARANQVPEIRRNVARFIAYHPGGILERECVVREASGRGRSRTGLFDLHKQIQRAMATYGYGAPELKEDSYVYASGRGWVLVDAGFAPDRGAVLARRATDTLRGRRFHNERPADLAFELRMEGDETIPYEVAARLSARLLALPDAHETPRRSAARRDS